MAESCLKVKNELSALMDAQVSGGLKSEIEEHLVGCQQCAAEYQSLTELKGYIDKAFDEEHFETPDIWAALSARLPSVCDVIQEDLSAYLDGELTAPAQEGVNIHLKECETCLESFKALNATNRLLVKGFELPAAQVVDLWSGVNARLNADCALIDNELSAYLDQEVVTLRHRSITKHLTDCQNCRDEFSHLSKVGDLIRDSYKPDIPEDFNLWGLNPSWPWCNLHQRASPRSRPKPASTNVIILGPPWQLVLLWSLAWGQSGSTAQSKLPQSVLCQQRRI
jgi:predicted anti-sigma-YlaC factor YlaD